jgi:hypothetical protein
MSIINFKHREDYGHDWYAQVLNVQKVECLASLCKLERISILALYTNQIGEWNYAFYLILGI